MTLWGSRFKEKMDPRAWALNASIAFDRRLADQDIRGSQAWAKALLQAGVLTNQEFTSIFEGLVAVGGEFKAGVFQFHESDEDIHTAVERRLGELIGPTAGKLHTGRSRNDQVATDLRLWLLDHLPELDRLVAELQGTLIERAETDMEILMPGYTHLQRAQPILLGHWWLSHFWPLVRDRQRLEQLRSRTASLPLGSGALAGVPFPVDRAALAAELGFERASLNSLDAVSDRDFVVEFLFWSALVGNHLSRLSESVILFTSAEFGFFELADAFATGSSLMPQKKNPDVFELARGKASSLLGWLTGCLSMLKGLPSTYDKDLQEDKLPVFFAYDTLAALLPVLSDAIHMMVVHPERMKAGLDAGMLATDLADYLVEKGIPFREAHRLVGKALRVASSQSKTLDQLNLKELQQIHPAIQEDVYQELNPRRSVERRNVLGGTAPEAVASQLADAKSHLSAGLSSNRSS